MKSVRNLLSVVCFALVSNLMMANGTPSIKKPESAQIQAYLENEDYSQYVTSDTKVSISFFINAKNEIIVVSTNNNDLDEVLKNSLNYKKIAVEQLMYNKIYTVPVVIHKSLNN